MAVSAGQLNRFERTLFRVGLIVAVLIVVIRVGAFLIVSYLHHIR
jgi:hypothetical protein